MCITFQCEMSIKNYPFAIYALRCWPEKASWFLSTRSLPYRRLPLHQLFLFRTARKLCFCFSRNDEWILALVRSSSFMMTPSETHIPGGHDLVACRRSKRGEFCCFITIIDDNSYRTRAWTWPSLVISDLFPEEHVQTPGGQASLETWHGLTLASGS